MPAVAHIRVPATGTDGRVDFVEPVASRIGRELDSRIEDGAAIGAAQVEIARIDDHLRDELLALLNAVRRFSGIVVSCGMKAATAIAVAPARIERGMITPFRLRSSMGTTLPVLRAARFIAEMWRMRVGRSGRRR